MHRRGVEGPQDEQASPDTSSGGYIRCAGRVGSVRFTLFWQYFHVQAYHFDKLLHENITVFTNPVTNKFY